MQMFILDGNLYDTKFLEGVKADGTSELDDDTEGYMLLLNKKKVSCESFPCIVPILMR